MIWMDLNIFMHVACNYHYLGWVLTDPGSFNLTDISYRLRFSFVSFACIVRSFAFRACNLFFRFVYHSPV